MRRTARLGTISALLLTFMASQPVTAGPSAGGFSSDNVEWVSTVAFAAGYAEGGRRFGDYFYVPVNTQGLYIFDISDPSAPQFTGRLAMPAWWENEDVATNGKIALLSELSYPFTYMGRQDLTLMHVVDISNKANPAIMATLPGGGDHTYECLYECKWAYGSVGGAIYDLRDPANPKMLAERWTNALPEGTFVHDVTEVRPGLAVTASVPMFLLDVKDVTKPRILATAIPSVNSGHNVIWPNAGRDRLILTATEYPHEVCPDEWSEDNDAAFQTWDASRWKKTHTLYPLDNYRVENGTYADGDPAASGYYGCSAHWFDPHPSFRDGGLVAVSFYGHGVKLLGVGADGSIEHEGYFLGHGANSSASYWITDEILYSVDMHRGIDVLRVDANR